MIAATGQSRIEALLASMTLEEKIGQLSMIQSDYGLEGRTLSAMCMDEALRGRAGSVLGLWDPDGIRRAQEAAAQSRLGVPLLVTADVLHGYETIFPIPLGEAAAFDPTLWEATARAAASEAAAGHIHLTFAPMLDVARDARWGRMAESPGEDPWLAARYAEAKVRGFQQDFSSLSVLAATAKHLGAYGAVTAGREYHSVDISDRSLHEIHLPAFAAAVRAGVSAIMPSFNDLAGVPMAANASILRGVVRGRWGFVGVIVSDYNAVAELMAHGVAADAAEAAALALGAGVDIDMVSGVYHRGLPVALERGLIEESMIDEAVRRVLALKQRLGLLDGARLQERAPPPDESAATRKLAREATRKSIVLLQNRGDLLPLRGQAGKLAVIGPLAANREDMLGCWHAAGKAEGVRTILSGVVEALPGWSIASEAGSGIDREDPVSFAAALSAARDADVVLLCLGESSGMSGEAASRADPGLPACQRQLAEAVFQLGKPVIAALCSGRPLTAPWLFEGADAALALWSPGSEAGPALGDVLTGASCPSGKLPVSWPVHVGQMPIFYAQRPTGRPHDPERTDTTGYIDMPAEPLFAFGHGLSYARFVYRALRLSRRAMRPGERVGIEADIANESDVEGEETALLFIRDPVASVARPVLELKGIAKIALAAGAVGTVRFEIGCEDVAFPDATGATVLETGAIEILVGPKADRTVLLRDVLRVETGLA